LTQSQDGDGSDDKYRAITVSERELKKLSRQLDRLMQEKKVYLNPDLRTGDLAEMLGTTQYVLSYLLNQHLKIGYYDYVNNYRIEEFKNCVKHEEVDRYTLDALAVKCGFSSRTSFFRYFKKVSGKTPSEYIREQRGEGR
jgi:YesN/AraC family two-component response regulator